MPMTHMSPLRDERYARQFPSSSAAVVWTVDSRYAGNVTAISANLALGSRVVIPRAGTISGLSVFIGTASGNIDVGVYSVSGTSRTKLYSSGSTAAAGSNAWQSFSPSLVVNAGDIVDFCIAVDNGTVTIGRIADSIGALASLPSGYDSDASGSEVLTWAKSTSFPLPASFSSVTAASATTVAPIIVAKLT